MPLQHKEHKTGHDQRPQSTVAWIVTARCDVLKRQRRCLRSRREARLGSVDARTAQLNPQQALALAYRETARPVSGGVGSKQEMRWGEDGREGQLEALSKR